MNVLHQRTAATGTPAHDDDGNMTNDGGSGANGRTFVRDVENRLMEVWNKAATPKKLATCTYDYKSRRVKKQTTADAPQGATHIAYLYDGWNVIAEYDLTAGNPSASPVKRHDWGLDLSGSLQGAGGVGGLIRTKIGASFYFPCYDGNGNVTDLRISGTGDSYASWQYDPFGRQIYASGLLQAVQLYRFSTKPFDRETEFCYYGYRYYNPVLGRWLNRDPIGERGGVNLYGMVRNNAVRHVDTDGRALFDIGDGPQSTLGPGDFGAQFLKGKDGKPNGKIGPKFLPISEKYCPCLDMLKNQLKSDTTMEDIYKKLRDAKNADGTPKYPTPDDIYNAVDAETKPRGAQTAGQTDASGKASSDNLAVAPPCDELHESITAIHEQAIQNLGPASTTGEGYANE